MSRRKVVTEITIETNQVLVVKRRQVSRLWYGECRTEVGCVQPKEAEAQVAEARNHHAVEALSGSPHFSNAVDGFHVIWVRCLLGAATLAKRLIKRLINGLRRGSKREKGDPRE
ncbi:MAG TPA: hypothetical protein VMU26_30055 [Candidatus Polarisedimenticolia bacterium]|nr:hypothetical protein [Candidatus Polarisedimenticolia bacterium]